MSERTRSIDLDAERAADRPTAPPPKQPRRKPLKGRRRLAEASRPDVEDTWIRIGNHSPRAVWDETIEQALNARELSTTERWIVLIAASWNYTFPPVKVLAYRLGLSQRRVKAILARLVAEDWIAPHRSEFDRGDQRRTEYRPVRRVARSSRFARRLPTDR